jgi:hypothetical protein
LCWSPNPRRTLNTQSNCAREDGIKMLKGLLDRWGNPANAPDMAEHQKVEIIDSLVGVCKAYQVTLEAVFSELFDLLPDDERIFAMRNRVLETMTKAKATVDSIDAQRAFAREVDAKGVIDVPPQAERH